MEEEAQKRRNTDCVYFLASPLTCKKGAECEYRHSESARLNPRDCWYWTNSTCRNPSCSFRHPPLDGLSETVPEAAQLPTHASVPTSKANVPCYFYFNAYCIKGDQCPFMHELLPAHKPKAGPETSLSLHSVENKTSSGSDTGPPSIEVPAKPPMDTSKLIKQENPKEIIQQSTIGIVKEEPSPSAESSAPDCEEPAVKSPEKDLLLLPSTEYTSGSPQPCADQGSDEDEKECAGADEWLESSPGFDVLVDDGSDHFAFEDDAEYLVAQERESEMLHNGLLQYDYEVPPGYDPLAYPDAGYLYDHGVYDASDRADIGYTPECYDGVPEHANERRNSVPTAFRKRRPSSRRKHEAMDDKDVVDLRDHLKKRRRSDGSPRKRHVSQARESSWDRPRWLGPRPLLNNRLVSEVGNDLHVSAHRETEPALNDFHGRGWSGYPQSTRPTQSRHREREDRRRNKRPLALSSDPRRSASRRSESSRNKSAGATFSGPKTLAEIKEEKRRQREAADGNSSGGHITQSSRRHGGPGDFEGPKPLNELLKDKRRTESGDFNGSAGMASGEEHQASGERESKRYESDYLDDDDDEDEDALREKLVQFLS